MALVARRRAGLGIEPHAEPYRGHPILVGEARHAAEDRVFEDRAVVALDEDAGGLALGVLQNLAVEGRRGLGCDAGNLEGGRVGHRGERRPAPPAPDGADVDRMVGGHLVQVVAVGIASVLELLGAVDEGVQVGAHLALHGHDDDPFSGRRARGRLAHGLDDLGDRLLALDADAAARLQALAVQVGVGVVQAGRHRLAGQVDDLGKGRPALEQRRRLADPRDAPVAEGHGLGDGRRAIEGDDLAVVKNGVVIGHETSSPGCRRIIGRPARPQARKTIF